MASPNRPLLAVHSASYYVAVEADTQESNPTRSPIIPLVAACLLGVVSVIATVCQKCRWVLVRLLHPSPHEVRRALAPKLGCRRTIGPPSLNPAARPERPGTPGKIGGVSPAMQANMDRRTAPKRHKADPNPQV